MPAGNSIERKEHPLTWHMFYSSCMKFDMSVSDNYASFVDNERRMDVLVGLRMDIGAVRSMPA